MADEGARSGVRYLLAQIDEGTGNDGAKEGDPFDVHPFLRINFASLPTGGTELGEKLKEYTDKNITSAQEFLKSLSEAKDFQDVVRIHTEFMHSQMNALVSRRKALPRRKINPLPMLEESALRGRTGGDGRRQRSEAVFRGFSCDG